MPRPLPLTAGIDLGSTSLKLLVVDGDGTQVACEQVATPWRSGAGGTTELDAPALRTALDRLVATTAAALPDGTTVAAIGIAGMGETGYLVDDAGEVAGPAFAWFDPRGAADAAAFSAELRAEFPGRTGLPLGAQVSLAKLAHERRRGVPLERYRWLSIPEFAAAHLGGDVAAEYSLASRTGLLDQNSGEPWQRALDELGVTAAFLPPLRWAGSPWGTASAVASGPFAGAALTVAGHDHLVAAEALGSLHPGRYHVSMGTAEVILRVTDAPLPPEARARLAAKLINEVRHIVPGRHVIVAGVKSGLLLRRALQLAGIGDRDGRDELDAAVSALPFEGVLPDGAIVASGARNDDGVLALDIRSDGVSPAELFGAVLRHSNDEIRILLDAIERELPPATTTTLTGGWSGMSSVRRARSRVLPDLTVSTREQDTAHGAALLARTLLRSSR
ncbi:carbohydrate kinase [Microbacterium mangrovi]|uniref:Carbohydrate kinase n=1 Tax=Microbacterium mangrovi TaxID=1348253 RepID=A0A0B2A408_9MICO|nr:FGGY family carbohydrate kinase [Microbacterium mangrovi]KHK96337.1 carbohydrate kinase [Microbacterium mangrovi]